MADSPSQVPGVTISTRSTGASEQLSEAVTSAGWGIESQAASASVGTPASTGAVVSSTVTTCVCEVTLSHSSAADHVRVIVELPRHAPGSTVSLNCTSGSEQLSLALSTSGSVMASHSTTMSTGRSLSTGMMLSATATVAWAAATWLHSPPVMVTVKPMSQLHV